MVSNHSHIKWLIDTKTKIEIDGGRVIEIWEFQHEQNDTILSEWATHFRNHYCLDTEIDILIHGTGKSRKQYLNEIKFPDISKAPGPSIRSGDFAEVLIADYLEFICHYWVPRQRYINKAIRNESLKGSDVIGFKISKSISPNDEMIVFEVKATLSNTKNNRIEDAVKDSDKDEIRKSESLNAMKQRFFDKQDWKSLAKVERFQNKVDNPFKEHSGAAAVLEKSVFDETDFSTTFVSKHYNHDCLSLIIVKGENMMKLVNDLYTRAADEA